MNKLFTGLMSVFLCLSFNASAWELKLGGASIHTTSSNYTNSFHRVFVVSHKDYFAGYFKNSYDTDSFVIGKSFVDRSEDIDLSIHTGLVWGYRESSRCYKVEEPQQHNDKKIICPFVGPEITFNQVFLKPSISWPGFDAFVLNVNLGF